MKQFLRSMLKSHPVFLAWCSRGYRWRQDFWRPLPGDLGKLLRRILAQIGTDINVVQIGANDGISGDPLYGHIESVCKAVLVEPVPHLYLKLKRLHANAENIFCVNAAITSTAKSLPFYTVDDRDGDVPEYFDQLGSFCKGVIEKQQRDFPQIKERIKAISVVCMTFEELCREHQLERVDLIHIDAEGYDLEILNSVDLEAVNNEVLIFEHAHVSDSEYREFLNKLSLAGYWIRECGTDTIAWRKTQESRE